MHTVVSTYVSEMKPWDGEVASSRSISLPSGRDEAFSSSVIGAFTELHDSGNHYACATDDLQGADICKQRIIEAARLSRKEKRKNVKKIKRKQIRQQAAEEQRVEIELKLADPVEQQQRMMLEEAETAALEKETREREIQERLWVERERKAREEAERKLEGNSGKEWDLIESEEEYGADFDGGPAEIIWQGNEIIVKKRGVKMRKKLSVKDQNEDRPISNPLPPQSVAFEAHKDLSLSIAAPQAPLSYESFEQNPNFGTEQDKTHCPFHIKTGACRFGMRCSRVHVYPEKSCTFLMKNMYTGPGLAWEHDEGLEYTDEEVAQHYEEFYEDVHCEFLKFGELVNFKVCRNVSAHLRGNVYVHYQSEAAALTAFNAMNGRYFAGKQVFCEFVGVTRWRVAICGEYMKAYHQSCSHGTACNFLHCFRNPGGEYDWADWDASPPLYWQEKMGKLFEYKVANWNHDDKDRKGGQREYIKRRDDASKQQLIRDHISEDRHRRRHTHNGKDDRSRFRSSNKHRHGSRRSRESTSEQYAGYRSETDSKDSNCSFSEDSYVTGSRSVRSSDTMKEATRKCHDSERDWSTGFYLKDSARQHRTKNHSDTSSENSRGTYIDDGHDAQNRRHRSLVSSRNLKRRNYNDERERSKGVDPDSSYNRQKKIETSTDMWKQKCKDFDRPESETDNLKKTASKQLRPKDRRRKGSEKYLEDSRSSSSDYDDDVRRPKSRSYGSRKKRGEKNVNDVSRSPEGSESLGVRELRHKHRLLYAKDGNKESSELRKDSEHEEESEQRRHKHRLLYAKDRSKESSELRKDTEHEDESDQRRHKHRLLYVKDGNKESSDLRKDSEHEDESEQRRHKHRLLYAKDRSKESSEPRKDSEHEDESEQRRHKHKHLKCRKSHGGQDLDGVDFGDRWQGVDSHKKKKSVTECL